MGAMEGMKICAECLSPKPLFSFAKDKRTSDGLRKICAECTKPSPKAKAVCGSCGQPKELGQVCKPCDQRRKSEYKVRHSERVKKARSEYKKAKWAAGAEQRAMKRALKDATRKARHQESKRKWKEKNKHMVIQQTAKRFASKLNATPSWARPEAMQQVYLLARFMTESTGVPWHVDHIVPLRGKSVCGLHVEHNLTFLPAAFNIAKSNKFDDWADIRPT
jgi:predicted amidophosphoribosyltransferase